MESLSFRVSDFEGPLDVLLTLVNRHKMNIYDIEISKLLEQYLEFISDAHEQNLELAGEFLETASKLIYIKTASLLPKPETAEKMKKELEGVLIEYSMCRSASADLALRYCGNDIFVRSPLEVEHDKTYTRTHDPLKLTEAYRNISVSPARLSEKMRAEKIEKRINTVFERKIVSVMSKAVHILRELYSKGEASMAELYSGITDRSARVAVFLAILELTRSGRIGISDDSLTVFFKGGKDGKTWKSKRKSVQ